MPSIDEIRSHIIVRVNNGSGVILSPLDNGMLYIFTCKHVVEDKINDGIIVRYDTDQNDSNITFELIDIITDETHQSDAAIIRVKRCLHEIPHVYPSTEKIDCYHIGFPTCRTEAVENICNNRVSYISHFDGTVNGNYIEYEYQTSPQQKELRGMSGGGIFNVKGCLVGIHTQSSMDDSQELLGKAVMIPVCHYLNLINTQGLSPIYKYDLSQFGEMVSWVFDFSNERFVNERTSQFSADIDTYKSIVEKWSPYKIFQLLLENGKIRVDEQIEGCNKKYWQAFTLFVVGIIALLDLRDNDGENTVISLYEKFHYCYSDDEIDVYDVQDKLDAKLIVGKRKDAYLVVGGLNKTVFYGSYVPPKSIVPDISRAEEISERDIARSRSNVFNQMTIIDNNILEIAVKECANVESNVNINHYRNKLREIIKIE